MPCKLIARLQFQGEMLSMENSKLLKLGGAIAAVVALIGIGGQIGGSMFQLGTLQNQLWTTSQEIEKVKTQKEIASQLGDSGRSAADLQISNFSREVVAVAEKHEAVLKQMGVSSMFKDPVKGRARERAKNWGLREVSVNIEGDARQVFAVVAELSSLDRGVLLSEISISPTPNIGSGRRTVTANVRFDLLVKREVPAS